MTALKILSLVGVTVASVATAQCGEAQQSLADLPPDVAAFVARRAACSEWSRKVFEPDRVPDLDNITSMMRSLKCYDLANDERSLRERYSGDPATAAALKGHWTRVVKRLPIRIPVPSDLDQ